MSQPATACRFTLSSTNPNEQIGGGGCACYPVKGVDQHGPFAVFPAVETDSGLSPHLVVCVGCAAAITKQVTEGDELYQLGTTDVVDVTATEDDELEL